MLIPNITSDFRRRACMYDICAPIFMILHCFAKKVLKVFLKLSKKFDEVDF